MPKHDLFYLIKPYGRKIIGVFFCILGVSLLSLAFPWTIKILIDDILISHNRSLLPLVMILLLGFLCLRSILSFLRTYASHRIGETIVRDLRQRIYDHVHRLSLVTIDAVSPSQILNRLVNDADVIRRFLSGEAIEFIYSCFSVGFILIVLLFLNLKLTLLSLVTLVLFSVLYFYLIPELRRKHAHLREMYGHFHSRISEVLSGMRVVRVFARHSYEKELFSKKQNDIFDTAGQIHFVNSSLWTGIEFFTFLGMVGVLWLGGEDVAGGRMTVGELVAFYTYLGMMYGPIIRIVVIGTSYQEAMASLRRIKDLFQIEETFPVNQFSVSVSASGRIEFNKVHFQYSEEKKILTDISFIINPGETVGIVGASGAGKTTLISLLLRFLNPYQGEIAIDGYNLKYLDAEHYRRQIAVVLQDDFLFNGTIEENIRYGKLEASFKEIVSAAKMAQAHSFIRNLPQGYKTQIGDRGFQLSSGQRQRLSIARALIRNPSILILDEATSAVDALTENDIQQSIRQYMKGKTTLIVAHRFSTIMQADKIIVLEKGGIIETGNHNYLLNKGGFYSSLYFEQFKEKEKDEFPVTRSLERLTP